MLYVSNDQHNVNIMKPTEIFSLLTIDRSVVFSVRCCFVEFLNSGVDSRFLYHKYPRHN